MLTHESLVREALSACTPSRFPSFSLAPRIPHRVLVMQPEWPWYLCTQIGWSCYTSCFYISPLSSQQGFPTEGVARALLWEWKVAGCESEPCQSPGKAWGQGCACLALAVMQPVAPAFPFRVLRLQTPPHKSGQANEYPSNCAKMRCICLCYLCLIM